MALHTENSSNGKPMQGYEALFARIQSVAANRLGEVIAQSISSADKYLYDICQQDQTTIGSPNIENLRLFRSASHAIERQFLQALGLAFSKFQQKIKPSDDVSADLSLVDIEDMDDVVNAELVTEALQRNFSDVLDVTSQRFCALLGLSKDEHASTPLTDKSMAEFLRVALAGLEVTPKVRATLFRCYESTLVLHTADLLEEINAPMVAAGILPHLQAARSSRKPEQTPATSVRRESPSVYPERVPVATRPQSPAQHSAEYSTMNDMPVGVAENALFDEICNYLHSWRPQHDRGGFAPEQQTNASNGGSPSNARRSLSKNEMISLLSSMQGVLSDNVSSAMSTSDTSVSTMLKSEMLNSARNMGIPPESVSIMREDEDALDLVGMLFDVLMSERDFRDEAKTMMSRLVVPYTKAAVLDRRLFLTKAHPARKLLNVLTEAIEGNQGDGPQERELLSKAEGTVEKLVTEFNEDIAVFEMLEQELRAFLDQHRRRIDLAEKRAKEAQRGQDRLEHARAIAQKALDERCQGRDLPGTFQEFFSRYWTHHLSMLALREGEDSLVWDATLKMADDLLAALAVNNPQIRTEAIADKRMQLESVLASSGILGEPATAIIGKLLDSSTHSQQEESTPASAPTASSDASAQPSKLSESNLRMVFNKDALDYDAQDVEFFKSFSIGSWLQLEGSNGSFTPVKLAWISPISSRLMFVNRRGVRVLVVSVEELAQMKKQGKLIVHAQDNVFEQTMDRVLDRLKSDFGG